MEVNEEVSRHSSYLGERTLWWVQRGYRATVVSATGPIHAIELAAPKLRTTADRMEHADRLTVRPATDADVALLDYVASASVETSRVLTGGHEHIEQLVLS